jgi:hypothetical protein
MKIFLEGISAPVGKEDISKATVASEKLVMVLELE